MPEPGFRARATTAGSRRPIPVTLSSSTLTPRFSTERWRARPRRSMDRARSGASGSGRSLPTEGSRTQRFDGSRALHGASRGDCLREIPVPRSWLGERELDVRRYEQELACDRTSGSFMLVRREALQSAGLFDERFFIYSEEVDLCLRIRQAGWEIRHVPTMTILHHFNEVGVSSRMVAQTAFARQQYLRKHFSLTARLACTGAMFLHLGLRSVPIGRDLGRARARSRAAREGLLRPDQQDGSTVRSASPNGDVHPIRPQRRSRGGRGPARQRPVVADLISFPTRIEASHRSRASDLPDCGVAAARGLRTRSSGRSSGSGRGSGSPRWREPASHLPPAKRFFPEAERHERPSEQL